MWFGKSKNTLHCSSFVCFSFAGYAPIRFLGNTRVQLNLGYSFFYDLQVQKTPGGGDDPPGVGTGTEGAGEGENSAPGERRRKKRGGARRERRNVVDSGSGSGQVVEMLFRLAEQRSGVLLYSRTASSVHLIRVRVYVYVCVCPHLRRSGRIKVG